MSPLSAPVERKHLHTRRYEFQGYQRTDGLWDIEGRMTDTKTYGFPNEWRGEIKADEPIHDMWLRLTLDDDLVVRDIETATEASPFEICPQATPKYAAIKGARIGPGWTKRVKDLFGGPVGCTHHTEMLVAIATVAYQTIFSARNKWGDTDAETRRPAFLDTCHALASDSETVKTHWPQFYTGTS
jgi:hypothetical protein